jgi:hypothetical protein
MGWLDAHSETHDSILFADYAPGGMGMGPPVVAAPLLFKGMDQNLAVLVAILGLDVAARPSAAELGSITGVCQLRR